MIKKFTFTAVLTAALAGAAGIAQAQSNEVSSTGSASGSILVSQQTYIDVMSSLEAAGYDIVEARSTFLGRIQIMARNAEHMREIVVSRATGEVKRDVIVEVFLSAGGDRSLGASTQLKGASGAGAPGSAGAGISTSAEASAGVSVSGGSVSVDSGLGGSVTGGVSSGISGGISIGD